MGMGRVSENRVGTRYLQWDRHAWEHTGGGQEIPPLENSACGLTIASTFHRFVKRVHVPIHAVHS